MNSTLIVGTLVAVICTGAICVSIERSATPPPSGPPRWEYTVAEGSLADGKWMKGYGEKGWELVTAIGDGPTMEGRAFIFKRQKPSGIGGLKY